MPQSNVTKRCCHRMMLTNNADKMAKSADPYRTPLLEQSDLGLHCLLGYCLPVRERRKMIAYYNCFFAYISMACVCLLLKLFSSCCSMFFRIKDRTDSLTDRWINLEKQLENKTGNGFWTALLLNMA